MLTSAKAKKFQDGDRSIRLYTTISLQLRRFFKNRHNYLSEGLTFFPTMGSKRSETKHSPRLRGNRHTHTNHSACIKPGVHNKKNVRERSVNRPRVNRFFYLRSLASGYTIYFYSILTTPMTTTWPNLQATNLLSLHEGPPVWLANVLQLPASLTSPSSKSSVNFVHESYSCR